MTSPELLTHARASLALHTVRKATGGAVGHPLLLLHGLGERTPSTLPLGYEAWPGAVYGLDFMGHGSSTIPLGGGYTCELLMADADAALAHLGPATVAGRGLGAYVALLLAGGRPDVVRGAILLDGPGLAGGGPVPGSPSVIAVNPDHVAPPDPFALAELTRDPRPPDYATNFARQVTQMSTMEDPITVCAVGRPPWLEAVAAEPGVVVSSLADALAAYARTT